MNTTYLIKLSLWKQLFFHFTVTNYMISGNVFYFNLNEKCYVVTYKSQSYFPGKFFKQLLVYLTSLNGVTTYFLCKAQEHP